MIKVHSEYCGLGARDALKKALRAGYHLEFGAKEYCYVPGRIYVLLNEDGVISDAFEIVD